LVDPFNTLELRVENSFHVEGTPLWISDVGIGTPGILPVIENQLMWLWQDHGSGGFQVELGGDEEGSVGKDVILESLADVLDGGRGDHSCVFSGGGLVENLINGVQLGWDLDWSRGIGLHGISTVETIDNSVKTIHIRLANTVGSSLGEVSG